MWKRALLSLPTGFLLLSLLIGFTIRVWLIFQSDFWFDEAFTYHVAKLPLPELLPAVLSDNNPPLYYLLIHLLLKVSRHEVLLRLPSLILNIGAGFFLYKLLRQVTNRQTAVIAVSLFFVSPLIIYLATNTRLHAAGLFFITCTTYLFTKLANRPSRLLILTFFVVAVLGVYTQYYIVLLFLPLTWWVMTQKVVISLKQWLLILVSVLVTFLPWLVSTLRVIHNTCACPSSFISLPASLASPILGGIGEVTLRSYTKLPLLLLLFYTVVVLLVGSFFIKGLYKNSFLAVSYLFPLLILTILGSWAPLFTPKGFSIFSPLFLGIVAHGMNDLKRKPIFVTLLLMSLVTFSQLFLPEFRGTPVKSLIPSMSGQTNIPIAHTSSITFYSFRYYLPSIDQVLLTQNPYQPLTVKYIGGKTQPVPDTWPEFWLVDTENWVDEGERQAVLNGVYNKFSTQSEFHLDQVAVKLLKRK